MRYCVVRLPRTIFVLCVVFKLWLLQSNFWCMMMCWYFSLLQLIGLAVCFFFFLIFSFLFLWLHLGTFCMRSSTRRCWIDYYTFFISLFNEIRCLLISIKFSSVQTFFCRNQSERGEETTKKNVSKKFPLKLKSINWFFAEITTKYK